MTNTTDPLTAVIKSIATVHTRGYEPNGVTLNADDWEAVGKPETIRGLPVQINDGAPAASIDLDPYHYAGLGADLAAAGVLVNDVRDARPTRLHDAPAELAYTPPQTAADQVAALAPYYIQAAEHILGIEGDHAISHRLVRRAAERLVQSHDEYGAGGLFSYPTQQLNDETDDELSDAINYTAERIRREAEGIVIPPPETTVMKLRLDTSAFNQRMTSLQQIVDHHAKVRSSIKSLDQVFKDQAKRRVTFAQLVTRAFTPLRLGTTIRTLADANTYQITALWRDNPEAATRFRAVTTTIVDENTPATVEFDVTDRGTLWEFNHAQ